MSRVYQKLIALLLTAVMLFCALPMASAASPDRCVTMVAGEMDENGMIPIVVTAHNYIGLNNFDLQATVEEGVTFLDAAESPDVAETRKTKNELLMCSNPLNGKIAGYFYTSLLPLDQWQANLKPGQTLSDSFDPNHFVLGFLYVHFGETANDPSTITLQGVMHADGEADPVDLSIQISHGATEETFFVSYNHGDDMFCTGTPTPQEKKAGVDLTLSTNTPHTTYKISLVYNNGDDYHTTKDAVAALESWNTQANGKGTTYNPGDVYTADENLVLYPQWIAPKVGELPVPEKEGYTFGGWFADRGFVEEVTEDSVISGHTVLYARWTAKRGDVNTSDAVTADDARLVLRGSVGLEDFDDDQALLADMDGDDNVTAADARAVLRTAVQLDEQRYVDYVYTVEDPVPQN